MLIKKLKNKSVFVVCPEMFQVTTVAHSKFNSPFATHCLNTEFKELNQNEGDVYTKRWFTIKNYTTYSQMGLIVKKENYDDLNGIQIFDCYEKAIQKYEYFKTKYTDPAIVRLEVEVNVPKSELKDYKVSLAKSIIDINENLPKLAQETFNIEKKILEDNEYFDIEGNRITKPGDIFASNEDIDSIYMNYHNQLISDGKQVLYGECPFLLKKNRLFDLQNRLIELMANKTKVCLDDIQCSINPIKEKDTLLNLIFKTLKIDIKNFKTFRELDFTKELR